MAASSPSAPTLTASKIRDRFQLKTKWQRNKMNPLQAIALLAVLVLCASGLWRAAHQQAGTKMVRVLAAAKDMPCGTRVGFAMLRYISIPVDLYSRDMVVSMNSIVDHQCRTFLSAGEPIKRGSFFANADGLSANLASNERAVTLQLSEDELLDHNIKPDDLVDIIAIVSRDNKRYARTISQRARVLTSSPKEQTLARRMNGSASNRITLAVSPEVTELVSEAAETGKVRLVLRGRDNKEEETLSGVGPRDLMPDFVLKEDAIAETDKAAATIKNRLVPPPPPLPELPAPPPQEQELATEHGPAEWLVQVFAGSHKESLSVPQK